MEFLKEMVGPRSDADQSLEGGLWDFQFFCVWEQELGQEHLDSRRNRKCFSEKEKGTLKLEVD